MTLCLFSVSLIILLLLTSCPVPMTDLRSGVPPETPKDLKVSYDEGNGALLLQWIDENSGVDYEIHRVSDSGEIVLDSSEVIGKSLFDKTYPLGEDIIYKISAKKNNLSSGFTSSNTVPAKAANDYAVKNVRVSKLAFSDKIQVTWDKIENVNVTPKYIVYRSLINDKSGLVKIDGVNKELSGKGEVFFEDTQTSDPAQPEIPYYYSVKWTDTISNTEGLDSELKMGIFVSQGDENTSEPNDDWDETKANLIIKPNPIARIGLFMYRYDNEIDVDTYKIVCIPSEMDTIGVEVTLTSTFTKKLKYEFLDKEGKPKLSELKSGSNIVNINLLTFFETPNPPETEETLYFRLSPDLSETGNFNLTYDIKFNNGY